MTMAAAASALALVSSETSETPIEIIMGRVRPCAA